MGKQQPLQRLAFLATEFLPEMSGTAQANFHWIRHFLKADIEVLLVSPDYSRHPIVSKLKSAEVEELKKHKNYQQFYYPIGAILGTQGLKPAPKSHRTWNVDSVLSAFKPDLILCDTIERLTGLYFGIDGYGKKMGFEYAQQNNIPIVPLCQANFFDMAASHRTEFLSQAVLIPLAHRYWAKLLNSYKTVLVHSPLIAQRFRDAYGINNVETCQMIGIDDVFFSNTRPKKKPSKDVRVLYTGRLSKEKRVDVLVDAVAHCRATGVDVFLDLVGVGPEEKGLRDKFPGDYIRFHGWKTGPELLGFYRSTDIFVSPCPIETFGLSLVEAMASGAACIGANDGHTPLLIENAINGLLFNKSNVFDLSRKIGFLAEHSNIRERLGRRAIESAKQFTWKRASENLLDWLSTRVELGRS